MRCILPLLQLIAQKQVLGHRLGQEGLPRWHSGKNQPANAGDIRDAGLIAGSGRSPGGGHGNPLQNSCLENPKDRGAWWATLCRVAESQTWLKRLSTHAHGVGNGALVSLGRGDTAQSSRRPSSQDSQGRVPDRGELCRDRESKLQRALKDIPVPSAEYSSTHAQEENSKTGERTTKKKQVKQISETPQDQRQLDFSNSRVKRLLNIQTTEHNYNDSVKAQISPITKS